MLFRPHQYLHILVQTMYKANQSKNMANLLYVWRKIKKEIIKNTYKQQSHFFPLNLFYLLCLQTWSCENNLNVYTCMPNRLGNILSMEFKWQFDILKAANWT